MGRDGDKGKQRGREIKREGGERRMGENKEIDQSFQSYIQKCPNRLALFLFCG